MSSDGGARGCSVANMVTSFHVAAAARVSFVDRSPRQVGLAGSSAIVYSCIKALMSFFGLGYHDIPKHVLPSVVLSVENELGINAGLQVTSDR